jgi:hypothetical protein
MFYQPPHAGAKIKNSAEPYPPELFECIHFNTTSAARRCARNNNNADDYVAELVHN